LAKNLPNATVSDVSEKALAKAKKIQNNSVNVAFINQNILQTEDLNSNLILLSRIHLMFGI
jgi:release factor glutamine methyltransferase